jgi:hypothetical protein
LRSKLSRRHWLLSLSAAGALTWRASPAASQQKVTKAVAQYQDQPKGQQRCEICVNFRPPDSCVFVEGKISPKGWCQFFAARENAE